MSSLHQHQPQRPDPAVVMRSIDHGDALPTGVTPDQVRGAMSIIGAIATMRSGRTSPITIVEGGGGGDPGGDPPPSSATLIGTGTATRSSAYVKTGTVTTADIYVDPNAASNGDGSSGSPYDNIEDALAAVADTQRIGVHGGVLSFSSRLTRSTAWATGIEIFALNDERPILDFSGISSSETRGLLFENAEKEHWYGFNIVGRGHADNSDRKRAISCYGSSDTIKIEGFIITDWNGEAFYTYQSGVGNHRVLDTVAYRTGGGDEQTPTNSADMYVCTGPSGGQTEDVHFVRCVGLYAPDDCFDFYRGLRCKAIDCVAFRAGYAWNGTRNGVDLGGDGSGFKLGGGAGSGENTCEGCIAIECKSEAIKANSAPLPCYFYDSGAYGGGTYGFNPYIVSGTEITGCMTDHTQNGDGHTGVEGSYNSWTIPIDPADFNLADTGAFDYSLDTGSDAIGAGSGGANIGPSITSLELAKTWLTEIVP